VHEADAKFATASVRDLRERCKLRMREAALRGTKQYKPPPGAVAYQNRDYLFARGPQGVVDLSAPHDAQLVVSLHESAKLAGAGARRLESGMPLAHWVRFIPHKEYDGHWGRAHTYDTWDEAETALRRWAPQVDATLPLLAVRGAVAACQADDVDKGAFHAIKVRTIASTAGSSADATVDVYCPMFVVRGGSDGQAPALAWKVTQQDLKGARIALLPR